MRTWFQAFAFEFNLYRYAEHSHDEQFQAWLHDLVTVVESGTWSAVPALLQFPRAEPEIVLSLAAGAGQAALVDTILRKCPDAIDPDGTVAVGLSHPPGC